MDTPHSARDRAVLIGTRLFQKLFERVWWPFSPRLERAVATMFDLLIEAAADRAFDRLQAERHVIDPFEQELYDLASDAYTGETIVRDRRTQELTPEARGLADFERWKQRRQQKLDRDGRSQGPQA